MEHGLLKTASALQALQGGKDSAAAQLALLNQARELILPAQRLVATAKSAAPTVDEPAAALQLTSSARALGACLAELKTAVAHANDACDSLELESASRSMSHLTAYLLEAEGRAGKGKLHALGDREALVGADVTMASKAVTAAIAQLTSAIEQGDEAYANSCARALTGAVQELAETSRGFATTMQGSAGQQGLLKSARDVVAKATQLLSHARGALNNVVQDKAGLVAGADALRDALHGVVSQLPGQRDLYRALAAVEANRQDLAARMPAAQPDAKRHAQQQAHLNTFSDEFNAAAAALGEWAGQATVQELAALSDAFLAAHDKVMATGLAMAGSCVNAADRADLLARLAALSKMASNVLQRGHPPPPPPHTHRAPSLACMERENDQSEGGKACR
jgi:talin